MKLCRTLTFFSFLFFLALLPAFAQRKCEPVTDGIAWFSMFPRIFERLNILTRTDPKYKSTIIELAKSSQNGSISCEDLEKYKNYLSRMTPVQREEVHPITYNLSLGLVQYLMYQDKQYCGEQLPCSLAYAHLKIAYDNIDNSERWDREFSLIKDICSETGIQINKSFIEKFYRETKECKCKIQVVAMDSLGHKITEVKYLEVNGSIRFVLDIKSESEIDFSKTEILFDDDKVNKYKNYNDKFKKASNNCELALHMEIPAAKKVTFKFYPKDVACNEQVSTLVLSIKKVFSLPDIKVELRNATSLTNKIDLLMKKENLRTAKGLIEVTGTNAYEFMRIKVDPLALHSVYQDGYISGQWADAELNKLIIVIKEALVSWTSEKYFDGDETPFYTDEVYIYGGILGETDPEDFDKYYTGEDITFPYCESDEPTETIMNKLTDYCKNDCKQSKNMILQNGQRMNSNTQLGFLRAYTVLKRFMESYKRGFEKSFCIVTKQNSEWAGDGTRQRRIYLVFNIKIN